MIKSLTKRAASLLGLEIRMVNGGQTTCKTPTEELPEPTRRRLPAGRLKGLAPRFFDDQNEAVQSLLPTAWRLGREGKAFSEFDSLLEKAAYSGLAERVVEYPWVIWNLARLAGGSSRHLADAGCVLNHPSAVEYVNRTFDMIWFMNPAVERLSYADRVAYILGDVRNHRLPKELKFDVVTCLSTLEHVGLDTRRYGGPGGEVNVDVDRPEKNAFPLVGTLFDLVRPGGTLLISIPFGPFEYLFDERSGMPAFYIFDGSRLGSLISSIPGGAGHATLAVYKVVPGVGWVPTTSDDATVLPYAQDCAAAGGVALISIRK
jgi:SAM-dependent methyltransferase